MMRLLPGFIRNLPLPVKVGGAAGLGYLAYRQATLTGADAGPLAAVVGVGYSGYAGLMAGVGAGALAATAAADVGLLGRHGYGMLASDAVSRAHPDPMATAGLMGGATSNPSGDDDDIAALFHAGQEARDRGDSGRATELYAQALETRGRRDAAVAAAVLRAQPPRAVATSAKISAADKRAYSEYVAHARYSERSGNYADALRFHEEALRIVAGKPVLLGTQIRQIQHLRGLMANVPAHNPSYNGFYTGPDALERAMADGARIPVSVYVAAQEAVKHGAKVSLVRNKRDDGRGVRIAVTPRLDAPSETAADGREYRLLSESARAPLRAAGLTHDMIPGIGDRHSHGTEQWGWETAK